MGWPIGSGPIMPSRIISEKEIKDREIDYYSSIIAEYIHRLELATKITVKLIEVKREADTKIIKLEIRE